MPCENKIPFCENDVTLKEHVASVVGVLKETIESNIRTHLAVHAAEHTALLLFTSDLKHWKESHNNWQDKVRDRDARFYSREAHDDYAAGIAKELREIHQFMDEHRGSATQKAVMITGLVALVAVILSGIELFIRVAGKG